MPLKCLLLKPQRAHQRACFRTPARLILWSTCAQCVLSDVQNVARILQLKRKTPGDVLSVTVFNDKEGSKVVKVELGALGKTQAEVPLCAAARA